MHVTGARDINGNLTRLGSVAVVIPVENYQISITIDNSAGSQYQPEKADIRVFKISDKDKELTEVVFAGTIFDGEDIVPAMYEAIAIAIAWCRKG